MQPKLRLAKYSDCRGLKPLLKQLGYPLTLKQIQESFRALSRSSDHRVWVAIVDGAVAGMLHARVILSLNLHRYGEGYSACVDEKFRSLGIGSLLIDAMEKWLRQKKCNRIMIYSNIKRDRAHALYEHIGYKHISTSKKFEKWIKA